MDKNELWVCTRSPKRLCGWSGPETGLKYVEEPGHRLKTFRGTCPKCGGKSFYVREPKNER